MERQVCHGNAFGLKSREFSVSDSSWLQVSSYQQEELRAIVAWKRMGNRNADVPGWNGRRTNIMQYHPIS